MANAVEEIPGIGEKEEGFFHTGYYTAPRFAEGVLLCLTILHVMWRKRLRVSAMLLCSTQERKYANTLLIIFIHDPSMATFCFYISSSADPSLIRHPDL